MGFFFFFFLFFYKYFKISRDEVLKYTGTDEKFFKKYDGKTVSIVSALKAIGEDSSYSYRALIAAKNGIKDYKGTAKQNGEMLRLLKRGELIKP